MLLYSRVTRVKPLTTIRRERMLPRKGEVLARRGQEVTAVQVIARASQQPQYQIMDGAALLDVAESKVADFLEISMGGEVREGMPLLRKPGFLGRSKVVRAPVDGTLIQVDGGRIIIEKSTLQTELRAMMAATVSAIYLDMGVLLETNGAQVEALWDSGKEGTGKLNVIVTDPTHPLEESNIGPELRGDVLVAGMVRDGAVLRQAEDNGVRGLILGSLPSALADQAGNYSFPILVTDGIGRVPMATPIFELLRQSQGREAALFSRHTAAPGSRPEIVIPLPVADVPPEPENGPIGVGQLVRIIREPFISHCGEVIGIYQYGKMTEIGMRVPGVDVKLADGQIVFVPATNLDRIM